MPIADDLADILWEHLRQSVPEQSVPCKTLPSRKGRQFLSEYEIKRMIGPDKILKVQGNAIVSPLALDWLSLKGIKIVREEK